MDNFSVAKPQLGHDCSEKHEEREKKRFVPVTQAISFGYILHASTYFHTHCKKSNTSTVIIMKNMVKGLQIQYCNK